MNTDKKSEIVRYIQNQIANAEPKARAYAYDEFNIPCPRRSAFNNLVGYVNTFTAEFTEPRWVILHGVRGVGKTTLLAQVFLETKVGPLQKLYLSVDEALSYLNVSLHDILAVYEEYLNTAFERLTTPVYLFLDEIQYEPQWGVILKSLYDRSRKIFIMTTGSSAIALQQNPDVMRRAVFQQIYPMSYSEYIAIKYQVTPAAGLSEKIQTAFYESKNAALLYSDLKECELPIKEYLAHIPQQEITKYLQYGTLPFSVRFVNEELAFDQIKKLIERVTTYDIAQLNAFDKETYEKFPTLLYLVAGADIFSLAKVGKIIGVRANTLALMLEVLVQAGLLQRVYPHGASYGQVKKSSKYLFATPSFRAMYFNFIGHLNQSELQQGRLIEDAVGSYLHRYLQKKIHTSLTYDSSLGGADFIVGFGDQTIILEVGHGKKGFRQVMQTSSRVKAKYGISISLSPLLINNDSFAVSLPFEYFLLM